MEELRGKGQPVAAASRASNSESSDDRLVAVMHGRDLDARDAVFDLLRRLNLKPMEWESLVNLTGNAAPHNVEAVKAAFDVAQAVVVVLTPDDVGFLHPDLRGSDEREDDRIPSGQPRLNVVLEAGMAMQSHPTRTVLLELGRTREISDLAGRNTIRLDGSPQRLNAFATRLENAGCLPDRQGGDWLDGSNFKTLAALKRDPSTVTSQEPASDRRAAIRQARHVSVELASIDATVAAALTNGHWWNVQVEGLPGLEWPPARNVLSDDAPDVYNKAAAAYVAADQLNKGANNHFQGGHDEYGDDVREQLEDLRRLVATARDAIARYVGDA